MLVHTFRMALSNIKQYKIMNNTVITYIAYLIVAVPLTIWVAKTLHKNGRVFLIKSMKNDESLADSVNHLLITKLH